MALPPRLKSISIQDFRGFPGTGNPAIELNGKNLLVYGENGAGKSTIFKALDQFFSFTERGPRARRNMLDQSAHIFTPEANRLPSVEVTFTDGAVSRWDANGHPNDHRGEARVFAASYRKGMLDYRSLLDLSYRYLGKRIDLFDACERVLLRDLQIAHEGSERGFHRLWRDVQDEWKKYHFQWRKDAIDSRLASINAGLRLALPTLQAQANLLLGDMLQGEMSIDDVEFTGLAARWVSHRPSRKITGQSLLPTIKFRGEEIESPQTLLNEARVSALAIAIYLAGRKVCGETLQPDTPKLLVLDDLLIGLDQSNRLPVLRMLTKHFAGWQIILLTHDRVWFQMAREHLPKDGRKAWAALEMFEGLGPNGFRQPIHRPLANFRPVEGNIARAEAFLNDNFDNAAAVHTRMAFEQSLKRFCSDASVPVRFQSDPRHLTTEHLLVGIEQWLKDPRRAAHKASLATPIREVKAARKVVLNPFSHSTPVTLVSAEVREAIDAVKALEAALQGVRPSRP